MREFLLTICPVAIWCIVALETLIAIFLFRSAKQSKKAIGFCSWILTLMFGELLMVLFLYFCGRRLSAQNKD